MLSSAAFSTVVSVISHDYPAAVTANDDDDDDVCVYGSESGQSTLVCRLRRSASPHRRRISTFVTERCVTCLVDVWNDSGQRQLSVDDTDAPWTASQPHPDELQPTGLIDRNYQHAL